MKIIHHNTAGCYLIRHTNKGPEILLIYNEWTKDDKGWVLPKGHVEEGETLEETAIRETAEETGYRNIKIKSTLETLHIEYPEGKEITHKKDIHWFLAELIDNKKSKKNLTEEEENRKMKQRWVTLGKAIDMLRFDDEREIVKKVQSLQTP